MAKGQKKQWFKHGVWWKKIRLNRKHKDRLFRYLFKDKKYLLELYNALHDSAYTNPEDLEVVTMEDVIFMKMVTIYSRFYCMPKSQRFPLAFGMLFAVGDYAKISSTV